MNLLCNYKSETFEESDLGYYIIHNSFTELYSISYTGECSSHLVGQDLMIPKHYSEVVYKQKVSFMPFEFIETKIPGFKSNTKALVHEGIYITYLSESGSSFHLMQALFKKAQQMTSLHKNLVYFWLHEKTLVVLLFKDKQFYMGNLFDVENHAEVLYFVTASMQDAKFDTMPYYLVADISERDEQSLGNDFEKLSIHMDVFNRKLPYAANRTSDVPNFASSLMYLFSCALPEVF
jgi:hypothetical protein